MPSYSNSLPYRSSVFKLRRRLHFPRRCIRFGSDDCNQRYLGVENNTKSSAWLHLTSCSKSLMNELNKRKIRLTWKLFKVIIFIVCVACFSWQSTRFFKLYFAYPTATSVELTFPSVLKYPAITFCNNNPVKREKFCAEYPYLCQKPNRVTEFCENHPHFCRGNVSNLVIPKLGYYASDSEAEVRKAILQIYIHNISQDGTNPWSWTVPNDVESKKKVQKIMFH
ncbi:uncharacterized protein NPIL_321711 [Nephila pilipes]|uniref:Uncharacterized protein n=1 Tax=Nephila pilipes TaxID=299642 RepID=A0A8X6QYQ9_NEPPI|nr:uncharacterized protein NPIL_321711 [Nephila pilipes]